MRFSRSSPSFWRRWPFWALLGLAGLAAIQFGPGLVSPAPPVAACADPTNAGPAALLERAKGTATPQEVAVGRAAAEVFGEGFVYAEIAAGGWAEVWATDNGGTRETERERWRPLVKALSLKVLENPDLAGLTAHMFFRNELAYEVRVPRDRLPAVRAAEGEGLDATWEVLRRPC